MARIPLHRHQLAVLTPAGWHALLARAWDAQARECLSHWSAHRLPLVVTRQPAELVEQGAIALGLPAPCRWARRRFALQVPYAQVLYFDEFPRAEQVSRQLRHRIRRPWQALCAGLQACGVLARVHGSFGWQQLTGLDHVRSSSDLDLWIAVSDAPQADAVAQLLDAFPDARPRLDGELVFPDGAAVAWREWLAWRAGRARSLLVKRLEGCSLCEGAESWLGCSSHREVEREEAVA
jgi:phosphoribosyl-dephospho-CoA transferase